MARRAAAVTPISTRLRELERKSRWTDGLTSDPVLTEELSSIRADVEALAAEMRSRKHPSNQEQLEWATRLSEGTGNG